MKKEIYDQINPFIRYAKKLENCNNENHILPWRHIFDYELIYVTDGSIIVETNTEKYSVGKNQLHIMPPFVEHTRYFEKDAVCTYSTVHLDFFYQTEIQDFSVYDAYIRKDTDYIVKNNLKKRGDFAGLNFINRLSVRNNRKMASLFAQIIDNYVLSETDIHAGLKLKALGFELVSSILRECEAQKIEFISYSSTVYNASIEDFVSYVKHNYMKNISIKATAKQYGMSLNNFNIMFKKYHNCSPYAYITLTRLLNSKILLLSGKYTIKTVANLVGYDNEHYFSRLFSIHEKCTPTEYIKKYKK